MLDGSNIAMEGAYVICDIDTFPMSVCGCSYTSVLFSMVVVVCDGGIAMVECGVSTSIYLFISVLATGSAANTVIP